MNNNLPKIFGIGFLVLMLGLSIYILSEKWEIKIDESTCRSIADEKEQGKCFYDLAMIEGNDVFCRKIKDSSDKDKCHYDLAVDNSNLSLCVRAGENEESCYKKILEKPDNKDLCEKIENRYRKEKCYYHLAVVNNDLDLCDQSGEWKETCREKISGEFHKPDLRILGFGYKPTRPKEGDKIKFTISVENNGEKKTNRFSVLVEVFEKTTAPSISKGEISVSSLGVDGRKTVYIEVSAKKAGNLLFRIKVDSKDEIDESNEGNNERETKIYISEEECTDSDGGRDYYVRGKTTIGDRQFEDKCSRSTLTGNYDGVHEYYCRSSNSLGHVVVKCSHGCNNGECFGELMAPQCIDNDGGENIYVSSGAFDEYGSGQGDCCVKSGTGGNCVSEGPYLREGICKPNPGVGEWVFTDKIIKCPYGCKNGACIEEEEEGEKITECTDPDGGKDYYTESTVKTKSGMSTGSYHDLCWGGGDVLHEWYCDFNNKPQVVKYQCPDGCQDGACVKKEATSGPDLVVSDISWQPATPTEEDNICISATIKNVGNEAVENDTMTAWTYINDYHAANTFYGKNLSPGKSLTMEIVCSKYGYNVWFRKGKNIVGVEIDPSAVNIVQESKEYNNQMEKEFFIFPSE